MVVAAQAFLGRLEPSQAESALWTFPSNDERRRWYYTPTDHGGLPLGEMSPAQEQSALKLVASGLSQQGFVAAASIIGLENILDELEGWSRTWSRERGRDPRLYYVRIFGQPGDPAGWSWRFGGHHISLHYVLLGEAVVATTPCFLGADPAASPLLGSDLLRPLGSAEDVGRQLVKALDDDQRKVAVLSAVAPVDLVGVNRAHLGGGETPLPLSDIWRGRFDGALAELVDSIQLNAEMTVGLRREHLDAVSYTLKPKGISAAVLRLEQQRLLRDLVAVYFERIPHELAEVENAKYGGDRIRDLWFAWAGGLESGEAHYYRVQGSRLLIEYDNSTNHVHSVWRDPVADFGDDVLGSHYEASH